MNNTEVIKKDIYPLISKNMDKCIPQYKKYIGEFISARTEDLYDTAPCRRIFFTNEDKLRFFNTIKVDSNLVSKYLNNTYYASMANFNPAAAKDETNIAMLCVIRYFLLNKNKYKKELSMALINYAFSGKMYPSIHYGFFQTVQPIEYRYVMDYVVNEMLTNKFELKVQGNVIGAVRSMCETWVTTYDKRFKEFDDEDCVYLIQQLHGRIKSFMKNIASLYYKAYENKDQYINYSSDDFSEDNFRIANSDVTMAESFVSKAMNKIINEGINYKYCQMASSSLVRPDEVKSIIEWIIKNDTKALSQVKELISLLVFNYIANNKDKSVRNVEFIVYSATPKPNSKDPNYTRQKIIIENWLDTGSSRYRRRKTSINTKNMYIRAVTMYFTLVTHYANL